MSKVLALILVLTPTLALALVSSITISEAESVVEPVVEWEKTYGGSDYDRGYSIIETSDGYYVIAGSTYSKGAGGSDVWVIKLVWSSPSHHSDNF